MSSELLTIPQINSLLSQMIPGSYVTFNQLAPWNGFLFLHLDGSVYRRNVDEQSLREGMTQDPVGYIEAHVEYIQDIESRGYFRQFENPGPVSEHYERTLTLLESLARDHYGNQMSNFQQVAQEVWGNDREYIMGEDQRHDRTPEILEAFATQGQLILEDGRRRYEERLGLMGKLFGVSENGPGINTEPDEPTNYELTGKKLNADEDLDNLISEIEELVKDE